MSEISKILTKYNCDVQVLLLNGVKSIGCNSGHTWSNICLFDDYMDPGEKTTSWKSLLAIQKRFFHFH